MGLLLVLGMGGTLTVGAPALRADEGGMSWWLPGQFGSLAAVPPDPGFSLGVIYYHSSVDADAEKNVWLSLLIPLTSSKK